MIFSSFKILEIVALRILPDLVLGRFSTTYASLNDITAPNFFSNQSYNSSIIKDLDFLKF